MSMEKNVTASAQSSRMVWIGVALLSHFGWGAYPVLVRYLQTKSGLPALSINAAANIIVLAILAFVVLPRIDWRFFRARFAWVFGVVIILRSTTNILAPRYTLAMYAQLMTLMTPFIVALLSATFMHEQLPRYTGRALALSFVGATMMTLAASSQGVRISLTTDDWIGIGLALTSAFFLAIYMIFTRRAFSYHATEQSLLAFQSFVLMVSMIIGGWLVGEDWSRWATIGISDWLVFLAFALLVILGGNLLQMSALRRLSAPLVTALLASRLIATLIVGALLLGEYLTSIWQFAGAIIVFITITWYLWQQRAKPLVEEPIES